MATSWKAKDVACPFYIMDEPRLIACEGFTDGSTVYQKFKTNEDYKKQMTLFCCCDNYKKCELYRMLATEKYDGE